MGGIGRKAAQNNIVFETELQDFEGCVRFEAVAYEYPWFLVSTFLGLGVEYQLEPLQTET